MWQGANHYACFRYRLIWDGRPVAGFQRLIAGPHGHGSGSRRAAGEVDPTPVTSSKYEPLTLTGGVTGDAEFARWASTLSQFGAAPRLDAVMGVFDARNRLTRVVRLYRVWISKFEGTGDLNATGNEVAIESLTLEHEGLEIELDNGDGDDDRKDDG